MRLHLIRHPAPVVAPGVCYGSSDMTVDQDAIDSALARCLPDLPDETMTYFVSPMERCTGFALELLKVRPFNLIIFDQRLVEMDFGAWELQPWDQIAREEIDAWVQDPALYRPGGGESVFLMACRVQHFYLQMQERDEQAAVVCHAGTIRLLHACQLHDDPLDIALHASKSNMNIDYGKVFTLDLPPPDQVGAVQAGRDPFG